MNLEINIIGINSDTRRWVIYKDVNRCIENSSRVAFMDTQNN